MENKENRFYYRREMEAKREKEERMRLLNEVTKDFSKDPTKEPRIDKAVTGYGFIDDGPCKLQGYGLHYLCGHRGTGKTSFVLNIVSSVIENNGSVMYFAKNESAKMITKRLLTITAGVKSDKNAEYTPEEENRIQEAKKLIADSRLVIEDALLEPAESIYRKCTLKIPEPNLIIIDGESELFSFRFHTRDRVHKLLRALAYMCKCHVFVLSDIKIGKHGNDKLANMIMKDENPREMLKWISKNKKIEYDEAMLLYRKDYFRVSKDHDMVASLIMPTYFDTRFIKGDMLYDLSRLKFAEEGCEDLLYLKTETERIERVIHDSKKKDSELVTINELLVSEIQKHKEKTDSRHHIAQGFVPDLDDVIERNEKIAKEDNGE